MGSLISFSICICYVMFYLLCNGGLTHGRTQTQSSNCATSCGHLLDIHHPFRLKTDPAHCGSTYFEITCDTGKPYLEWSSGKYYIIDISYFYQTINVVDPVYMDQNSCKLPNYPFEDAYPDNYFFNGISICESNQNAASFLSCTKQIQNSKYISCTGGNDSFIYVLMEGSFGVTDLEPSCRYLNSTFISDVEIKSKTIRDAYVVLRGGFQLCWFRKSLSMLLGRCLKASSRYFRDQIKDNKEIGEQTLISYPYWYWGLYDILRWYGQHAKLPLIYPLVNSELFFLQCMGENVIELTNVHYIDERTAEAVVDSIIIIFILLQILQFIIVLLLFSRLFCMPSVVFVFLTHKYRRERMHFDNVEKFLRYQQALAPTRYSYTEIIAITRNFREKLGEGGFGSVFKGSIFSTRQVAVKMLGSSQLHGEEFINEVSTLCKVHHKNIVRLIGYCSEGSIRALVYEYMPNGSLDKHIFSSKEANIISRPFSWEKLKQIALEVAKGIDYLHRDCDMQILHFDIKPHNILLDNNFVPKVSDFGLAKFYPKDSRLVSASIAKGTAGYIAPELLSRNFGGVSDKCDVYSFGMLLLEMAGGRRNWNPEINSTSQEYYPSWIYDQLVQYKENEISTEIDEIEVQLCTMGLWCIQIKPSDRPSMRKVVEMLAESTLDSSLLPPRPFFS
ncbi:hypothetical protein LUZ61_015160 [Rhynchospora tenuis]|uniref:Protein kinase domain-containing protein n=1 Tax=Rhynchospora tenuis TaxID=198213 RepID=A0AAD5WCA3_9POAL|nr:hypothetical protein LUZ61_015160 [Rhynchospora tenuis]